MNSSWMSFVLFCIPYYWNNFISCTSWEHIEPLGNHFNGPITDDKTRDISKILGELEDAFLQGNCDQPLSTIMPENFLEQSIFTLELSSSKLLAGVVMESDMISTKKSLIEILTKEILHSQDSFAFVVIFIKSTPTNQIPIYVKISKNSTKITHSENTETEKATNFLERKLKNKCDEIYGTSSDIIWTKPYSSCDGQALLGIYHVVYNCNGSEKVNLISYLESSLDLRKIDINQCNDDISNPFANTNLCPENSLCLPIKNYGFRNGGYTCTCKKDHFTGHTQQTLNGSDIVAKGKIYRHKCKDCVEEEDSPCSQHFSLPDAVVVTGLSGHIIVMISMLLPGLFVAKLRKTKTLSFNFWQLYEVMLGGGILIYLSVIVEYMDATLVTCILKQWLREIGFVVLYSSMMLKIHRMRVECRSRQAQRVMLRDKDLIRYLVVILLLITWQLLSWTVIKIEYIIDNKGRIKDKPKNDLCEIGAWHHVIEIEEFAALVCFVYLCCSVSPPPSFAIECRAITFSLANEAIFSAVHNALKHFMTPSLNPRSNFLMSVIRCHLTVSINLIVLMSIKLWQAKTSSHVASSCRRKDGSLVNAKQDKAVHRPLKPQTSTSKKSQENKDSNDINLSGLNPEDVKAELRRLYKQLEIYKAKSSRKDVSHNIKKQATRKSGPRRFSLYNFHHGRHSKHHSNLPDKTKTPDDCTDKEHSRITPEESTNSCEVWNLMSTIP